MNNDTTLEWDTQEKLRRELDHGCGISVPKILFSGHDRKVWYGGGNLSFWKGSPEITGFTGLDTAPEVSCKRDVAFATAVR